MTVGKRSSPVLLWVIVIVIAMALGYFFFGHGPDRRPNAAPIHAREDN